MLDKPLIDTKLVADLVADGWEKEKAEQILVRLGELMHGHLAEGRQVRLHRVGTFKAPKQRVKVPGPGKQWRDQRKVYLAGLIAWMSEPWVPDAPIAAKRRNIWA